MIIGADVEWKVNRKVSRKIRLTVNKWDVYGSQIEQREYKDLSSMRVAMTQVGEGLNEEIDKYCHMRKIC